MLVKINGISPGGSDEPKGEENHYTVRVTLLDIDDLGSVIPLRDLELQVRPHDESILETLKSSHYAAIFTEGYSEEDGSIIILANGLTEDNLNKEKEKTIKSVNESKHRLSR
jgi:hypothetical protein